MNLFLAITLLLATSGILLSKHYCLGRLKSVTVFEHAKGCADNPEGEQMPCCEDVETLLKVEEVTQVSFDFDGQPTLFLVSTIEWLPKDSTPHVNRTQFRLTATSPPTPDIDFQSAYSVYLI